jgi:transposase-like protein
VATIREVVTVLFQQGPKSPWFYTAFNMMDEEEPFRNTERHIREGDRFVARWLMKAAEGWEFWPGIRCVSILIVFANWSCRLIEATWR